LILKSRISDYGIGDEIPVVEKEEEKKEEDAETLKVD